MEKKENKKKKRKKGRPDIFISYQMNSNSCKYTKLNKELKCN